MFFLHSISLKCYPETPSCAKAPLPWDHDWPIVNVWIFPWRPWKEKQWVHFAF